MQTIVLFENRQADPIIKHVEGFDKLLDEKDLFFYNRVLKDSERRWLKTSPWMNRMGLGEKYIIIPKHFKNEGDIRLAVSDRFAVVKTEESGLATMSGSDIEKIKTTIEDECAPKAVARKKQKWVEDNYKGMLFQTYRAIYAFADDKYTQKLRKALMEDSPDCEYWSKVIEDALKTAKTHPKDEEEMHFFMFLIDTHYKATMFSAEIQGGALDVYAPLYSLKAALRDPVKKEMLIKALDTEALRIYSMALS